LLVDTQGERLTPSHAVKNGPRYRYYVSAALITEAPKDGAPSCQRRKVRFAPDSPLEGTGFEPRSPMSQRFVEVPSPPPGRRSRRISHGRRDRPTVRSLGPASLIERANARPVQN
jgi:hypothetical protein